MDEVSNDQTTLNGRRVLLVEDESTIIMMMEDSLQEIGCEVVGIAARYDEAHEKALSLTYDVAILDVNLNGRQTIPLAETLAERGIPFVFSTGYGKAIIPEALQSAPVLQKPFQLEDLERALLKALAGRPA